MAELSDIREVSDNPLFDLQRAIYSSKHYTRRRLHQIRLNWVRDAIRENANKLPGSRAIEYGPGSGIYLPFLADHFSDVIAADIELAYLKGIQPLLAESHSLQSVQDDIQASSFEDCSFDLVLCSEVLEHVPNPEVALKTIFRILKPGGIAVVTTPQRYSIMELCSRVAFLPGVIQLVRRIYREPVLDAGHISLRSFHAFSTAVESCGFEVVKIDRFGLYVPLLAEFGGASGGRAIEAIERPMRNSVLSWLLWTQAYVLRKPA